MGWTDLNPDDLAQVSYPDRDHGLTIVREPGPAHIVVQAMAKGAHKVVFLRVPEEFHHRLSQKVRGSKSAAIIALMEEALTRLEEGEERWRVVSRDSL